MAAAAATSQPGKRCPRGGDLAGTHACIMPVSLPIKSSVWRSSSATELGGGGVGRRISRPRVIALSWLRRDQQKPSAGTGGVVAGIEQAWGVWSEPGQSSTECVARRRGEAHVWSIVDGRWCDRPPRGCHVGVPGGVSKDKSHLSIRSRRALVCIEVRPAVSQRGWWRLTSPIKIISASGPRCSREASRESGEFYGRKPGI